MYDELRQLLASRTLSARAIFDVCRFAHHKSKGQNFIFDRNIARKIVDAAGDLSHAHALEVGPGPGALTLEILYRNPQAFAIIELDHRWAEFWNTLLLQYNNVHVLCQDAMQADLSVGYDIVISNLPYNVSSGLLVNFMRCGIRKMVLMFQKELADRIISKPARKTYGKLSVLAQTFYKISHHMELAPHCFSPPPKVRSCVLKFEWREDREKMRAQALPSIINEYDELLSLCFSNRRKVLRTNIADQRAFQALRALGYSDNVRAEEISVKHYAQTFLSAESIRGMQNV